MNSKKILLIISLTLLTTIVVLFVITKKTSELVNPNLSKQSSPVPPSSTESFNPPKEIKYDSSTDLKQELKNIDPKVLDSDFEDL